MSLLLAGSNLALSGQGPKACVLPLQALGEEDLDDCFDWDVNEIEEATGNEGATFGRLNITHASV